MFSSVQSLSRVRLFATPACQASLSITNSRSSLRLMSIESVMPSSHLILCCPLLLLRLIPPSIRVFFNESTLRMRWPKYWNFSLGGSIFLPSPYGPARQSEGQRGGHLKPPPPLQAPALIPPTWINQDFKDFRSENVQGKGQVDPLPEGKSTRIGSSSFQEIFVNHLLHARPCHRSCDRTPLCCSPPPTLHTFHRNHSSPWGRNLSL